ncbi:glutathione S-transferase theta-1 [Plodia interpunctella]|uniref:glutathione S-transferase theta-1 n=1 Tax=Plodia interpunctella TaxID=58824 RepID=UPI0023682782|nr:glutathione S-transferase theta-1 [Plodia interpunctella]
MGKMTLKLYYDLMSQPSRALYILLKTVNCKFESKYVDLRKGEHYSDEFTKVNRIQRVPVIDHNGFVLTESVAIYKYLSREGIVPESLFPKESQQQARVEEFLEWHHIGLRLHTAMYFRAVYLDPIIFNRKNTPEQTVGYQRRMETCLEDFSTKWLGRGHAFVVGDKVTVADLVAACELEQPRMAGYDPREKFSNIAEWYERVRSHFNPHYDEAHVIVNKVIAKNNKTNAKL